MEWLRRLVALFYRSDDELTEEVETHRALVEDELRRSGLSTREAAAESRRRMGNVMLAREDSRHIWNFVWLDRLRRHLRYGMRGLFREPVFALSVLTTIAAGTAATTTVLTVVDAELWRPLPYVEPHRLLAVGSRDRQTGAADGITLSEFQTWRQRATALETLTAYGGFGRRTTQLASAESLLTADVTASFFTTLGRRAFLGRVFAPSDATNDVAVLTSRGWSRVFASDPGVIGRSIALDDRLITIVGIVATDDSMGLDGDLYVAIDEQSPPTTTRFYTMIGRLAPSATAGVVIEQIQTAIDERAVADPTRRQHRAVAENLSSYYRTTNARPLYFFLGASVLVLLLTTANAAGLIVSRAVRRTPEFAVRSAIGGGSSAMAAQLAAESALITVPGCAFGLVLTHLALGLLGGLVPQDLLYRGTQIAIDERIVAATLVIVAATTAGLALVPLAIIRRAGERAALSGSRQSNDTPLAARLRRALLAVQLALTVTLLAGTGVFLKSFVALIHAPLGFDPANVWSLRVALSGSRFASSDAQRAYVDGAVERLTGVPGVRHVAAATTSPLRSGLVALVAPSPTTSVATTGVLSIFRSVGPDYFLATGTPIIRGRGFTRDDGVGAPLVAIVNESFARRVFDGADPLGRLVDFAGRHAPMIGQGTATIVGVVADVKEINLNEISMPDLYMSFAQRPSASVEFVARAHGADPAMSAALRAAVADPFVPVIGTGTFQARVAQALARERFFLMVVAVFAFLAVLSAAIGVYGSMAYFVATRRRDFGVRLALGASPQMLVRGTLAQAARLGSIGGGIGVAVGLVISRWIGDALYMVPGRHNGLLYNTTTTDPVAMFGALIGVMLLSVIAAAVPARRASKVNPAHALRAD